MPSREDAERTGFTYSWIYHGEVKRLTSFQFPFFLPQSDYCKEWIIRTMIAAELNSFLVGLID